MLPVILVLSQRPLQLWNLTFYASTSSIGHRLPVFIEHQSVGVIQSLNRQLLLICADKYVGNSWLSFAILALRLLAPHCVSDAKASSLSFRVVFLA